jgi:hypothetical protein
VYTNQNKWFTISLVIITLVIGVIFLAGYPFRSSNSLKVSFVTFTNDVNLGKMAVFALTNTANEPINCMRCNPQIKIFGSWSHEDGIYGPTKIMPAHTTAEIIMPITTNEVAWREPVFWIYGKPSQLEDFRSLIIENLRFNWLLISRGRSPRYFNFSNGNSHYGYSETITNK